MPNPARSMGVNPILGLTAEPVNELIGDCCGLSGAVRVRKKIGQLFLRLVQLSVRGHDWPRIRA
jgi:hypothetical protein